MMPLTPSVVTTQYTDRNGNVVKTGKVLDGVEYFDTYTFDYVGNPVTYLSAKDSGNSLPLTAEYEYNEHGQASRSGKPRLASCWTAAMWWRRFRTTP